MLFSIGRAGLLAVRTVQTQAYFKQRQLVLGKLFALPTALGTEQFPQQVLNPHAFGGFPI